MTNIPIKSYHCATTHSACDCVLERLKKLEKVVEAVKAAKHDLEPMFASTQKVIDALEKLERE